MTSGLGLLPYLVPGVLPPGREGVLVSHDLVSDDFDHCAKEWKDCPKVQGETQFGSLCRLTSIRKMGLPDGASERPIWRPAGPVASASAQEKRHEEADR